MVSLPSETPTELPTTGEVRTALRDVRDPELPISIVDLGIVERIAVDEGARRVDVVLLPTFTGCPALPMIESLVRERVAELPGVRDVAVSFVFDPPWTVDRITDAGRDSLRAHGVTVPERGTDRSALAAAHGGVELRTSAIPCPFCGSRRTRLDSPFGPARCRMIHYCDACRNAFEHLKDV